MPLIGALSMKAPFWVLEQEVIGNTWFM